MLITSSWLHRWVAAYSGNTLSGSEEHEVLQTGSIHGAILPSRQFLNNRAF